MEWTTKFYGVRKDTPELGLSDEQLEHFDGWTRPTSLFGVHDGLERDEPGKVDLMQDNATDCSVVASMCAATARTEAGHASILPRGWYPHDKHATIPTKSPNRKYVLRLHFNGCDRKVVIDDRLPSSRVLPVEGTEAVKTRSLHVVDRNDGGSLWAALLEKAYLKVRGGYDFPGSNSGTDLWVLSGWIPEQLIFECGDTTPATLWLQIYPSFQKGDVIVTVGTGAISPEVASSLGLVGEHDYAILDMRELGGIQYLLVKNPWAVGLTWNGELPATLDDTHFKNPNTEADENTVLSQINNLVLADSTDQMLSSRVASVDTYDGTNEEAEAITDARARILQTLTMGNSTPPNTFWIDLESLFQYFHSVFLNWNPALFTYRESVHFSWDLTQSETPGCLINNPQYRVYCATGGDVLLLLSRHFTSGESKFQSRIDQSPSSPNFPREPPNLGYISIYLFSLLGRRTIVDSGAIFCGPYVDAPQTLARIHIPPNSVYTIVPSQQNHLPAPYTFTLSAFSNSRFLLEEAEDRYPHRTTQRGAWTSSTAGGNAESSTYPINPQYGLQIHSKTSLALVLETTTPDLQVHVQLVMGSGERVARVRSRDVLSSSGDYRPNSTLLTTADLQPGKYTIICSTFRPAELGSFTLTACASLSCDLWPIPTEDAGRFSARLVADFPLGVVSGGVLLSTQRVGRAKVVVRYRAVAGAHRSLLRASVQHVQGGRPEVLGQSDGGAFGDAPMGVRVGDVDLGFGSGGVEYWLVVERQPMTGERGAAEEELDVEVLSEHEVELGRWEVER